MGFTACTPAAPLSQLVETIWDWDMPAAAHRLERILPSANGQLVLNLAEDETRVYDDALACQRLSGAAFDAPAHRSFVMDIADQGYGGRGYACRDPEGHLWWFGSYDPWQAG